MEEEVVIPREEAEIPKEEAEIHRENPNRINRALDDIILDREIINDIEELLSIVSQDLGYEIPNEDESSNEEFNHELEDESSNEEFNHELEDESSNEEFNHELEDESNNKKRSIKIPNTGYHSGDGLPKNYEDRNNREGDKSCSTNVTTPISMKMLKDAKELLRILEDDESSEETSEPEKLLEKMFADTVSPQEGSVAQNIIPIQGISEAANTSTCSTNTTVIDLTDDSFEDLQKEKHEEIINIDDSDSSESPQNNTYFTNSSRFNEFRLSYNKPCEFTHQNMRLECLYVPEIINLDEDGFSNKGFNKTSKVICINDSGHEIRDLCAVSSSQTLVVHNKVPEIINLDEDSVSNKGFNETSKDICINDSGHEIRDLCAVSSSQTLVVHNKVPEVINLDEDNASNKDFNETSKEICINDSGHEIRDLCAVSSSQTLVEHNKQDVEEGEVTPDNDNTHLTSPENLLNKLRALIESATNKPTVSESLDHAVEEGEITPDNDNTEVASPESLLKKLRALIAAESNSTFFDSLDQEEKVTPDNDNTELASLESILKELKSLIAEENKSPAPESLSVIASSVKEAYNEAFTENLKHMFKKFSRKRLKKLAKDHKKKLDYLHKSVNCLSDEITKSKHTKKPYNKLKQSYKGEHESKQMKDDYLSSVSSDSFCSGELPAQYQPKRKSRSRRRHSKKYKKSRYSPPDRSYDSGSYSRKRREYSSSSDDSSTDRKYKTSRSKNALKDGKSGSKLFRPQYSYSPESGCDKKKYYHSSHSSSIQQSFSKEITKNKMLTSANTVLSSSMANCPSTSSTVGQQTYEQRNSIIQKHTTVTTYKTELQAFSSRLTKMHDESTSDSDDSFCAIDLRVYNKGKKDVTNNRPGGDVNHTFYVHPEDMELFRVKLKNGAQPVQILHELCIKCYGVLPTYLNLPSQHGFKFGMFMLGHQFITSITAPQKKAAKAEIAKVMLQWLRVLDVQ